jgi:hypothetical protein
MQFKHLPDHVQRSVGALSLDDYEALEGEDNWGVPIVSEIHPDNLPVEDHYFEATIGDTTLRKHPYGSTRRAIVVYDQEDKPISAHSVHMDHAKKARDIFLVSLASRNSNK